MSFMKPSALYMFLITYVSFRWMPCQSWGFLRWPGLDGFLRLLVVVLLWSMFSEIRYITSNSMHPTLREHDRVIIEKASYYIRSPAVHDIVTFKDPTQQLGDKEDIVFIKRIVAKEGDLVQVNGQEKRKRKYFAAVMQIYDMTMVPPYGGMHV
ncbi:hypothetical protein ACB092_12G144100 [Castanea dentata]